MKPTSTDAEDSDTERSVRTVLPDTGPPASVPDVLDVLRSVLSTGALERIPKHPDKRDVVLALACTNLERRRPYSEVEINECLHAWLRTAHARLDHVTLRRYLVDCGFLRRDRAGRRYLLSFPKLESVLGRAARVRSAELVEQVQAEVAKRAERKARRDADYRATTESPKRGRT